MTIGSGETILNKYRVVRHLGEGGMARVWLAEEVTFGSRQVALKELRADLPGIDRNDVERRFHQEVEVCAALEKVRAPNIVPTYTVEPYEGSLLLVMAYMAGGDLADRIQAQRQGMPVEEVLAIARSVLAALAAAHEHPLEIVHRDIKPSNILFDGEGKAHLADFGLAQLSGISGRSQLQGGAHPGSPLYMPPEQASSSDYLTPAADVYALGCVLFEMLAGKRYKRVRPGTSIRTIREEVPAWLDDVLLAQALVVDPYERYAEAGEMLAALRAGGTSFPTPVVVPEVAAPAPPAPLHEPAVAPSVITPRTEIKFDWVTIPAGEFTMGSDKRTDPLARDDERPQHAVYLDDYHIGRTAVTNRQYRSFIIQTGHSPPRYWQKWEIPEGWEDFPVKFISWQDATYFCEWAGVRLPTEAEWEKAARGTDGRIFPWGNGSPSRSLLNYSNNMGEAVSVNTFDVSASPYGLLNMAGNVWEWCADWYANDYYCRSPENNPQGPVHGEYRVLRGGSYLSTTVYIRSTYRHWLKPDIRGSDFGFRVAAIT